MKELDEEIAFWTAQAMRSNAHSAAHLVAIGIRTGLILAEGLIEQSPPEQAGAIPTKPEI